jgi:hypothetical protein
MVLIGLDEGLFHQDGRSMALASTSDHRFYDRYWVGMYDPNGGRGLITGMGVYKNNDAIDAFTTYQQDGIQTNVRTARPLYPDFTQVVGPIRHEIIEPLKKLRFILEPSDAYPLACDLLWNANTLPLEEKPHFLTHRTRIVQDYMRYDQAGWVEGTITYAGEEINCDGWVALRDHAWGTRSGVGGFEPNIGPLFPNGFLYQWLAWTTGEVSGYIQIHNEGDNTPIYMDGKIRFVGRDDQPALEVVSGDIDVEFVPETRVYSRAVASVKCHDGSEWEVVATPLMTAWHMHGTGYDMGYDDHKAHGWHRFGPVLETDQYDISDLRAAYLLPNRERVHGWHREQPARISCNGADGRGHFTIIPRAPLPRYGFMNNLESLAIRQG